jgi:SAM-dependent methyltransferase
VNVFDALEPRSCPVCASGSDNAALFMEETFNSARLSKFSFASRKAPEFMSHRLLRCNSCRTVYTGAAPGADAVGAAYSEAPYDSMEEAALAADTYELALQPVITSLPERNRALEIGAGNGVFLEKLLAAGFTDVVGVEPSRAAVDAAAAAVRPFVRQGIFTGTDFAPESFDLICCFQTLEHVSAPRELTEACTRILRPGGALAFVAHDYTAPINRLLGRLSPIIDIEHLQLFCKTSLEKLLTYSGLVTEAITPLVNRYPLRYWIRLAPLPDPVKRLSLEAVALVGLSGLRIGVNVGNLLALGRKRCQPC